MLDPVSQTLGGHHLFAYTLLLGTVADTDVPAIQDDVLTFSQNTSHFLADRDLYLQAAWAGSATLDRVHWFSPVLRMIQQPYWRPLNLGVTPLSRPPLVQWWDRPIKWRQADELAVQATSSIAMGTERFTAVAWATPGSEFPDLPPGEVLTTRFTSTTAAVANVWSSLTITLENQFPPGLYSLIGSEVISTNAIAHRWIVPNQVYRPGALSLTLVSNIQHDFFFRQRMGQWGVFVNTNTPRLQVLCNAADASHVGYMEFIKIG